MIRSSKAISFLAIPLPIVSSQEPSTSASGHRGGAKLSSLLTPSLYLGPSTGCCVCICCRGQWSLLLVSTLCYCSYSPQCSWLLVLPGRTAGSCLSSCLPGTPGPFLQSCSPVSSSLSFCRTTPVQYLASLCAAFSEAPIPLTGAPALQVSTAQPAFMSYLMRRTLSPPPIKIVNEINLFPFGHTQRTDSRSVALKGDRSGSSSHGGFQGSVPLRFFPFCAAAVCLHGRIPAQRCGVLPAPGRPRRARADLGPRGSTGPPCSIAPWHRTGPSVPFYPLPDVHLEKCLEAARFSLPLNAWSELCPTGPLGGVSPRGRLG